MTMTPLQSIEALAASLRTKRISALEATEECLRQIQQRDTSVNAFVRVMAAEARRDANINPPVDPSSGNAKGLVNSEFWDPLNRARR